MNTMLSDYFYEGLNRYARSVIPDFPLIKNTNLIMGESEYFVFTLYTKGKRYGFTINAWDRIWDDNDTEIIFPTDGPIANIGSYCLEKFLIEFEKSIEDYTYWRKEHPFDDYIIPYVGSFSDESSGGVADRVDTLFTKDPNSVYHLGSGDEFPFLERLPS